MWPPKTDTIRNIDKSFLDEKNRIRWISKGSQCFIDKGLSCDIKRTDPIRPDHKKKLWGKGSLCIKNGDKLQHTIFFTLANYLTSENEKIFIV